MVLSDVSIKRPVFATVLSLVLIIFGVFGYQKLPIREYPNIDPPIISINTIYKGASAEIIESQITQIIEDAVAGAEGIRRVTATSREESSTVTIEFVLTRDIESAANDARDRIARILSKLPADADPPAIAKVDSDARPIVWLALSSERMTPLELSDYASRYLVDRFSTVPGVASVTINGERKFAMRVFLDKAALAARGLTVQDVESAIRRQNVELPSGRIESSQREFTVRTETGLKTPEEFRAITVREQNGYKTRLGEVATVELAAESERSAMLINGRSTVGLGILRQSTANALEISDGVKAMMERVKENLPAGLELTIRFDQSDFIKQSIYEVFHALMVAMALVIGVIFVFLRSWRATLIPALAIPVSILSSFIVLAAFGFSINVLTLLALVLAIGLVVDDAIVVLENIHRRIELGEPPLLASMRGARQIGFAVIATTVVLMAVFVPISLLEGNTGRLFREFGIAVAASVFFSGFVALTLTPMMCSVLLRGHADDGLLYRMTEPVFVGMTNGYRWLLNKAMRMPVVIIAMGVGASALAYGLYLMIPREFAPLEDRGSFIVNLTGPEGSSIDYTTRYALQIESILKPLVDRGDAQGVLTIIAPSFNRPGPVNSAFSIVNLTHWSERHTKQQEMVKEVFPKILGIPGVRAFAINPPSFGQSSFQAPVQLIVGGASYPEIEAWTDRIIARINRENPRLANVNRDYQPTRPEIRVRVDRTRAADLGVPLDVLGRTLETLFGSRNVTTFDRTGKQYNVVVQAKPDDRSSPQDLQNIFVRASTGKLVPLSNLIQVTEGANSRELYRTDRLRTMTVTASLGPDYALGDALTYLEKVAQEELPPDARVSWGGQSREFKDSSGALYFTFTMALLIVFLALAAQFESWIHPTVIMMSVPLAVTGALGALVWTGLSLNVYSQIGIIMLVGLIAKNAILIVEFANQLRDEGMDVFQAALESSVVRLRPILMTTIATVFGAVPLAMAHGAGAESRQALGVVVIGGMVFATILSLFLVPVIYSLLARYTKPAGDIARRLSDMDARVKPVDGHDVGQGGGHGHGHASGQPAE
ncbi:MAG: efflux RND transporter permease subunit [Ferrovibrionaceae bacterium]